MNILVVTPEPAWPPVHGAAVRNSHLIAALAERHTVDVVALTPASDGPDGPVPGARCTIPIRVRPRSTPQRLMNVLRGRTPDLVYRHQSSHLRAAVQHRLVARRYDAVHLEGLQLASLAHDVQASFAGARERPLVVYDAHNVEWHLQRDLARASAGLRSWYASRQAKRLREVERWVSAHADLVIASSADDAEALARLGGGAVEVVPHPVDVPPRCPGVRRMAREPRVLFAANFAYRPNALSAAWLFGSVWPAVLRRVPTALLRVIGPASHELRPIAPARARFGGVVDDVRAEYASAWLAVSPAAVGAGVPYKVLHAYAAGRPVIARASGLAGLREGARAGLLAVGSADEFASAVVDLLSEPEGRRELGAAGYAYVREQHAVEVVKRKLLEVYDRLPERVSVEVGR